MTSEQVNMAEVAAQILYELRACGPLEASQLAREVRVQVVGVTTANARQVVDVALEALRSRDLVDRITFEETPGITGTSYDIAYG